ncbi:MAG: RidA family protein [Chitinivibrionales bacterium]|nr:RidA family protein [Chitinivibrionales bacterium]
MTVPNNWCVEANGTIYFGGTAPVDEDNRVIAPGKAGEQTRRILTRYRNVLEREGLQLGHLAFVTVYLKDLNDYAAMNAVYAEMMPGPYPARKVVQAPMTLEGMVVEMTAVATRERKRVL